jgi:WD40 repeat protein
MKQILFLILQSIVVLFAYAQTEPRLVLPIGHTKGIESAVFSNNENMILTRNKKETIIWNSEGKILYNNLGGYNYAGFCLNDEYVQLYESSYSHFLKRLEDGATFEALEDIDSSLLKARVQHELINEEYRKFLDFKQIVFSDSVKIDLVRDEIRNLNYSEQLKVWFASIRNRFIILDYEGRVIKNVEGDYWYNRMELSPSGKCALLFSDYEYGDSPPLLIDMRDGLKIVYLNGASNRVISQTIIGNKAFLIDGKSIHVDLWNIEAGKAEDSYLFSNQVVCSATNRNGRLVSFGFVNGDCAVIDFNSREILKLLKGGDARVERISFDRSDKYLIATFEDGRSLIFDIESSKIIRSINTERSDKGLFNVALNEQKDVIAYAKERLDNLSIPDFIKERLLISDSISRQFDYIIEEDLLTGKVLNVFRDFGSDSQAINYTPDGRNILVTNEDGVTKFYSESGLLFDTLEHKLGLGSMIFSADNQLLLSLDTWEGAVGVWRLDSLLRRERMHSILDWEGSPVRFLSEIGYINHFEVPSPFFADFVLKDKYILTTGDDHKTILWETATGKALYTRLQLKDNDWLVYDEHYRFDGTPGAIEKLYFVCGLEPIELAQMKDSLWVPGLAEKIMTNQPILINDKPAPKLSELNICELTPVIEPIEQEDKRMLKYRITPRNGGLGNTEVYINGNMTYSIKPEQLEKRTENKKEVYYLTLNTDTLQEYLMGEKNDVNPVLVKCKVKGTGIYGRGVVLEVEKTTDEEEPHFYGVFIGVDEYGNPQKSSNDTRYRNLDFAAKDARDLSVAVEQTARNLFKDNCHIYRLTGTGNEAPTKENLQRVLADVGSQAKASDVLYIFFAGHGDIKKGKNEDGQEQDQIRFMLMNADKINPMSTSFGVDDLTKWCSPRNIKAQKRVFVFDACHSGKIIDQTMAFNGRGDDEGARIRQLDKLKDKNGMMILAAAADDESAYEDETLNQGVLTYHLLQVMKEEAKDTSLVVRDWFDETIDLVKEYSRLNGNKQEPTSFGDGRFEIGNVSDNVRDSIKITCPKTRVGACEISAGSDEAEALFPGVENKVLKYFSASQSRGNFVYSEKSDKAFRASGSFNADGNKISIRYKIKLGNEQVGQTITLPSRNYTNEDELVQAIVTSIAQEIEALSKQDERCKLMNK